MQTRAITLRPALSAPLLDAPPPGEGGAAPGGDPAAGAEARAVAAFAAALRLSCQAAQDPGRPALANAAVAAHRTAQAWAEAAVRDAARRAGPGGLQPR